MYLAELLQAIRLNPCARFRKAKSAGWALTGIDLKHRLLVGKWLLANGCKLLSPIHMGDRYCAFNFECPDDVYQTLWAEWGSLNRGNV